MKRLWISLLSLLLVFSIIGCSSNQTVHLTESSMEEMEMQTVTEESPPEPLEGSKDVKPVENESSSITSAVHDIRTMLFDSDVLDRRRFSSSVSQSQIAYFVSEKNEEIAALKKNTSLVAYFSYSLDNDMDSLASASVAIVDGKRYGSTKYVASVIA